MNPEKPEGWHVVVHRSLTTPILLGGLPRGAAILILMATLLISISMELWFIGLPLGGVCWLLGRWLTRQDPAWFDIGRAHLFTPSKYEVH